MEQKIEAALGKRVKLSYRDTPFADVIADLGKQLDLTITLDPEGLDEAGVTPKQVLSLEGVSLSARSALDVLLGPLHLSYLPERSGLLITSEEIVAEREFLRVYPVADLVGAAGPQDEVAFDYDTLIDAISMHVAPDYWPDGTGPGPFRGAAGCLVLRQSYYLHCRVEEFLASLRTLRANAAKAAKGEVGPTVGIGSGEVLRDALNQRQSLKVKTDLKSFVERIAAAAKIPILLDPEGLDEAGATPDDAIEVNCRDTRLEDILRMVVASKHLNVVMRGEFVEVTSFDKASEPGYVRLYPVGDLVVSDDFEQLEDVVQSATGRDKWSDNGGQSAISAWPNPLALVVTTTDEVHDEIEQLLAALRASGVVEFNAELRKREGKIVERIYPLYMHRREQKAQPEAADKKAVLAKPVTDDKIPTADEVAKLILELLPDASWKEEGVLLRPFHDRLIVRQRGPMIKRIQKVLQQIDAWPAPPAGMISGGFF